MSVDELKYLEDIFETILKLELVIGSDKRYERFITNQSLVWSAERAFEIIGESVRKFKMLNNSIEINNAAEIIALRNRIAHAYDSVDYLKLWAIYINHLPNLKTEVQELINKYQP